MRFLVDESTGKKVADLLGQKFDAVYAGNFFKSATDEELLLFAEKENRILVTDDKDFGELVFRLGKPSKGVLFLRVETTDPQKRFELLSKIIKKVKVEGKFIVVSEKSIRVRKIKPF